MAVETLLNALPWIVGGLILILLLAALRRPLEWLVTADIAAIAPI